MSDVVRIFDEFDKTRETLDLSFAQAKVDGDRTMAVRRGDCVWYALKEAMHTLSRLPDKEAGWLYSQRSTMPEVAQDYGDKLVAFLAAKDRIERGELPMDALAIRRAPPSARAITRMDTVFDWWKHLKGNKRIRDWKILCLLASGQRASDIAKLTRCSPRTVYERREFQCGVIALGLEDRFAKIGACFPDALYAQGASTAHVIDYDRLSA